MNPKHLYWINLPLQVIFTENFALGATLGLLIKYCRQGEVSVWIGSLTVSNDRFPWWILDCDSCPLLGPAEAQCTNLLPEGWGVPCVAQYQEEKFMKNLLGFTCFAICCLVSAIALWNEAAWKKERERRREGLDLAGLWISFSVNKSAEICDHQNGSS